MHGICICCRQADLSALTWRRLLAFSILIFVAIQMSSMLQVSSMLRTHCSLFQHNSIQVVMCELSFVSQS